MRSRHKATKRRSKGSMKNYKITIQYDGSRYKGWEHQPGTDMTIQGKLENVLARLEGRPVEVIGAGRTDAGVHAKAMVANVRLSVEISGKELKEYMNSYLPDDICIKEASEASERFHSRYNAIGKTYRYTCYIGSDKPVFDRKYVFALEGEPDIERMKEAAGILTGEHDFAGFCSNPRMKKSTVRKVDLIDISRKGDYLYFTYHGSGFLQHMVRIMTGTLLEVGFHKRTAESMSELLSEKKRALAGATAPAQGLCLMKVDYS